MFGMNEEKIHEPADFDLDESDDRVVRVDNEYPAIAESIGPGVQIRRDRRPGKNLSGSVETSSDHTDGLFEAPHDTAQVVLMERSKQAQWTGREDGSKFVVLVVHR
jgi:hypothetical protein